MFGKATLGFLDELAANNDRAWFAIVLVHGHGRRPEIAE